MSRSWFEQLEAQLDRQLEAFLNSHPDQQHLLDADERQERQRRLGRQRLQIQAQADASRQSLLELAAEITQWQQRVGRARAAAADALADQAETHLRQLMGLGRDRWQALRELGESLGQVEAELAGLQEPDGPASAAAANPASSSADPEGPDLEQAWAHFEKQQDLEELRRTRSPREP
jgi:hercynine metabolism protein